MDQNNITELPEQEKKFLKEAEIGEDIILDIKKSFNISPGANFLIPSLYTGKINSKNKICRVSFKATKAAADQILSKYLKPLREKGLLIFRSLNNYGYDSDIISLFKSNDQLDIVRVMGTDASEAFAPNEQILKDLQEWTKLCSYLITGASKSYVEAIFEKHPKNMRKFASLIKDLAPDVIEQGPGSIVKYAKEMKETNSFYLWWD